MISPPSATLSRRSLLGAFAAGASPWAASSLIAQVRTPVRIERVELIKVVVPMKPGVKVSENYGPALDVRLAEFDKYPKFLIKLHASNGQIGLGETAREVPDAAAAANAQALTGRDLRSLDLGAPTLGLPEGRTADGFEIAVFDLMGKTLGLPVCALLGGCLQKKVAVSYWTGQRTDADMLNVVRRAVEGGFKSLKFKARLGDDIAAKMAAVARAGPSLNFIVDFNSSYPDLASFLPVAQRLQGYNLIIEDPVPKRLDWFRQLRQRTTIPYALTPSNARQMFEAIRTEAVDAFNLGGNMREFARAGYLAHLAGIPCWHGSGVELGIRDMSFVHAAAATESCTIPSDTLCYLREHDLLAERFTVKDGFIAVPSAPGLGVGLDEDAVRRYRVA